MSESNQFTIFEYDLLIQEHHLDSFGHVNNAVYVMLYEEARWDFITRNGFGLDYIQKHQIGPVILDLSVRFKRELKNRERIKIVSRTVAVVNKKIIRVEQQMVNSESKVASEAQLTIGMFDMKERKMVEAGPEWLRAIGLK